MLMLDEAGVGVAKLEETGVLLARTLTAQAMGRAARARLKNFMITLVSDWRQEKSEVY
jgi:hypothetical protein